MWLMIQEKVYQHQIKSVGELRKCIASVWDELDHQRVIDRQSGSSDLDFNFASKRNAATLNTACPNEL